MSDEFTAQELRELEAELGELANDFGDFEMSDEDSAGASSGDLGELQAELSGTELEVFGADFGDGDVMSLSSMADSEADALFAGRFLKNKVQKLIRKLIRLVKKYRKLASCVPKVTAAVVAFKSGKYATALRRAWAAYRCIKSKL
ncbi:hypothetical protein CD351_04885 [Erythrobacter sp. KY5]|uniref:hypothetical protein n=1 Tax=Erythrobacter sp. KY5 TaxID=2011159 RepID=UPI000DBF2D92|nr:hypothetical protein [Erythrobacter sp. KY5]AWW73757.1 hypothetical protein CD351_04885 [Erythrobacter sp. KY5]